MVAHIKGEKSHAIIEQALQILERIDHRGAVGADPLLGDGAGLLMQIPDPIMRKWAGEHDVTLPPAGEYGVAMCFMPQNEAARSFVTEQFEKFTAKEGQEFLGWRDVPTTLKGLGDAVIDSMPVIQQAIIGKGANCEDQDAFERKLLVIRKQVQNPLAKLQEKHGLPGLTDLYVPSFSSRTIVCTGVSQT